MACFRGLCRPYPGAGSSRAAKAWHPQLPTPTRKTPWMRPPSSWMGAAVSSIGRLVPFAQAAFRQAYAGGHSLEDPDFVLIAAAACEMHPSAVLAGAALRSVAEQLEQATAQALRLGVG